MYGNYVLSRISPNSLLLQLKNSRDEVKYSSRGFAFKKESFFDKPYFGYAYMVKQDLFKKIRYDVFELSLYGTLSLVASNVLDVLTKEKFIFYKTSKGWFDIRETYLGKEQVGRFLFAEKTADDSWSVAVFNEYKNVFEQRSYLELIFKETSVNKRNYVAGKRKDGFYDIFDDVFLGRQVFYKIKTLSKVMLFEFVFEQDAYKLVYEGWDDTPEGILHGHNIILQWSHHVEDEGILFVYQKGSPAPEIIKGQIYVVDDKYLGVGKQVIGLNDE